MRALKKFLKNFPLTKAFYFALLSQWQKHTVIRDRKKLQRYGFDIVRKMQSIMEGRCCCYVEGGTMLGLVRDGRFMKYDDDMDFSIIMSPSDTPASILRLLLSNGFEYLSCYEYNNQIEQIAVSYQGLRVDVFLQRPDGEQWTTFLEFWNKKGASYSREYALTAYLNRRPKAFGKIIKRVQGVDVVLPENFEDLLAAEYGEGWRVPDPNWNPETDKKYPRNELPGEAYCLVPIERVYELG